MQRKQQWIHVEQAGAGQVQAAGAGQGRAKWIPCILIQGTVDCMQHCVSGCERRGTGLNYSFKGQQQQGRAPD